MSKVKKIIKEILPNFSALSSIKDEYFQKVKSQIMNTQEGAEALLDYLAGPDEQLSLKAAHMLSMFDCSFLPFIFEKINAHRDLKGHLLLIAWSIVSSSESRKCRSYFLETVPHALPLLKDKSLEDEGTTSEPIEIEYLEYRICDEAYLILQTLNDVSFDYFDFQVKDYKERDKEIQRFISPFYNV